MEVTEFLEKSNTAQNIKLKGRVIVHRASYSPGDIRMIAGAGTYGPVPPEERVCELEVNGVVLATGKIVRKAGNYYFKIKEVNREVKK